MLVVLLTSSKATSRHERSPSVECRPLSRDSYTTVRKCCDPYRPRRAPRSTRPTRFSALPLMTIPRLTNRLFSYRMLHLSSGTIRLYCESVNPVLIDAYKARFPFKRNRLRCVNENRKKHKRLRWQAGCSQSWLPLLQPSIPTGWRLRLLRENFTQQTQAPANRNARSKQWQP